MKEVIVILLHAAINIVFFAVGLYALCAHTQLIRSAGFKKWFLVFVVCSLFLFVLSSLFWWGMPYAPLGVPLGGALIISTTLMST
ncbi:MAG TPA: hypothetical protein VNK96_04285, partial [Fimbriimonadales bacterium]|nr:hypothetical protein [Fimbriimonadales bacterium]